MKAYHLSFTLVVLTGAALLLPQSSFADYPSVVLADNPAAYYQFNDSLTRNLINNNSGSLGASADASNDLAFVTGGTVHPMPGAIAGDSDAAEFFDFTTRTEIPFNAALNPSNTQPFTVESWIYPVSDQAATGMGVWCNRYTQGATRQGWVMYQRSPNYNYNVNSGPGVGWEFRMYNNQDSSGHLDVTSGVPFVLGQWQHVVVVYDPVQVTNATLTMYINGVAANTNIWAATDGVTPGYYPCLNNNSVQPNGPPAMSLGGYNNANGGLDGFENPWIGGIDEYAWYPVKLTPAQILAHYQNGTNANRGQSYSSLVQAANPSAYLRLDEKAPSVDTAINIGDARGAADATNTSDVRHPSFSPVGETLGGASSYHLRNGSSTSDLPWLAQNNPDAGVPFTLELWLRPTNDRISPGAAPINNRYVSSGHRTGWVIFQRAPDDSYAGYTPDYEGTGWTFRMYDGADSSGQDVTTGVDWIPGVWQHFVVTWEPSIENGDVIGDGDDQWQGTLTAYVNGVAVVTNGAALYAANMNPTEDSTVPADMAIGSYNIASGLGSNPYEGDVGQVAFYNNTVLTPDQILAHYQAGTNANSGVDYESLVFTAGSDAYVTNSQLIPERTSLPATYLTFNDPAQWPAVNSGSAGYAANGNLIDTSNSVAGPRPPQYAGFNASNSALPLDGMTSWASFNNPTALEISGQITLEAWIQPGTSQGNLARIISHGPNTLSDYLGAFGGSPWGTFNNAETNSQEVALRMDGSTNYFIGVSEFFDDASGTNSYGASFPIPAGDLGTTNWIYLVGTYDGTAWHLFRNGILAASQTTTNGALPVLLGDWAVGATGEGWGDNFSGAIDEVAIYNKALSPSSIASHYLSGTAGTSALTIVQAPGNKVTITWPAGATLQQATQLNGNFTDVPGSPVSPITIPATSAMFYRWKL